MKTTQTSSVSSFYSSEEVARELAVRNNVEYIKLADHELSPQIVRLIPESLVLHHRIIAVRYQDNTLYVAMTDPLNLSVIDEINLATGFEIVLMVASCYEIDRALAKYYALEQLTKQEMVDTRFHKENISHTVELSEKLQVAGEEGQTPRLLNSIIINAIEKNVKSSTL